MSKYTTELKYLVESNYPLGMDLYPIFDESYREQLNKKIIDHYYFREIGFETAELFKRFLNRTLNEIMPYYNQLYQSQLLKFDPLSTKSLLETYTKENIGSAEQTATGEQATTTDNTTKNINVFSDTPQSGLVIGDIQDNLYASSASVDNDEGNSTSNTTNQSESAATSTNTETLTREYKGYEGDSAELLKNFRSTFLNIDMLVIDELSDLFMKVW